MGSGRSRTKKKQGNVRRGLVKSIHSIRVLPHRDMVQTCEGRGVDLVETRVDEDGFEGEACWAKVSGG